MNINNIPIIMTYRCDSDYLVPAYQTFFLSFTIHLVGLA